MMELSWIDENAEPGGRATPSVPASSSLALLVRREDRRHPVVRAVMALIFCFAASDRTGRSGRIRGKCGRRPHYGADQDPTNWMTYGRTYSEQRFSPLSRITADNAKQLGLAWYADLDTNRGQEATPLVIDGVLYVSTAWSMVKAYDAKTGDATVVLRSSGTTRARCKRLLRRGQSRRRRLARKDLRR